MRKSRTLQISLAGAFLIIVFCGTATAQTISKNTLLLEAMSSYEDLTGYALAENDAKVKQTLRSLDNSSTNLKRIVSRQASESLNHNIQKISAAERNHDFANIALYAISSYKTLTDQLDVDKSSMVKELSMLDYVGFKIQALLKQKNVDWKSINEIVLEGNRQWNGIKKSISNKGLKDVMDTTTGGLLTAVKSKNKEMLKFAAQVDLDLVDLLEGYFKDRSQ